MAWSKNPTSAKVFIVVATILSAVNLVDFFFYGRHLYDLLGGVGFGLWAFGTYRNGHRKLPEASQDPAFSKAAYYASAAALVLVVASLVMRFWR
jgi:hypothetical protein